MRRNQFLPLPRGLALLSLVLCPAVTSTGNEVDFNQSIRPILSDNCFKCHGPAEKKRKAGLRLDTAAGAFADRKGHRAIVPRDLAKSALYQRITSEDKNERMPPPDSGKSLTVAEIDLFRRWIEQGAEWKEHWAFETIRRPPLPEVKRADWPKNEIDAFILARLEKERLKPSPPADRRTLIRRVSFDLTGLPPSPAEVEAFVNDASPDAYEKLVDRLLSSPHYGEHRARYWLDAVRYGDTHGMHLDNYREMWPYRDWVVRAFNANMPFDQFTTAQLAGDLLPNATLSQKIASGYNRAHVTTNEGGSIKEEVYVRNVVDRVETTGTVFLGLTIGCAVCHEHKFDPISQKEFYQLFAFFNSLDGNPMDGNKKDPAPVVKVYTAEEEQKLADLRKQIRAVEQKINRPLPELDPRQAQWAAALSEKLQKEWQVLDPATVKSTGGATLKKQPDLSVLATGKNPDTDTYGITARTDRQGIQGFRLEALTDPSLKKGTGRAANSNFVLSEFEADAVSVADPSRKTRIRFVAAQADYSQKNFEVARAIDGNNNTGWAVDGNTKKEKRMAWFLAEKPFGFEGGTELRIRLRHEAKYAKHSIGRFRLSITSEAQVLRAAAPSRFSPWQKIGPFPAKTHDEAFATPFGPEKKVDRKAAYLHGKLKWVPQPKYEDAKIVKFAKADNTATYLFREITAPSRRRMKLLLGSDDGIKVWVNSKEVFSKKAVRPIKENEETVDIQLEQGRNQLLLKISNAEGEYGFYFKNGGERSGDLPQGAVEALGIPEKKRSPKHRQTIRDYYRSKHWPEWKALAGERSKLKKREAAIVDNAPTTLVMKETAKPRPAYLLTRGQYDQRGKEVTRAVPRILPPFPEGAPLNRLGFAQWLTMPDHPLTARVTVNRFWQQLFGVGLVKTAEDFGAQGDPPVNRELLDWLARNFIDSRWNVKGIFRKLVLSATYQQSSKITPELQSVDPENRLLARGPRFRLDAEELRDQALAASGLLVDQLGGPSVKPPQPAGLWFAVGYTGSNTSKFKADTGDKIYRRSVYTFWKRTSPPPQMTTFDAPSREACCVRRERTNTPLQALLLMNETEYFESARNLAHRMIKEGGATLESKLDFAFLLTTSRRADRAELQELLRAYRANLATFKTNPEAARKVIQAGSSKPDKSLDAAELAAWTMVANLILNLDEVLTKG